MTSVYGQVMSSAIRCPTLRELPPPLSQRTGWPWTEESPQLPPVMPNGQLWPRISIVTASYNQGQFIEETIRSVLLQGYPNLEYMILDGGSTDDSLEIIRRYEPWLSYVFSDATTNYATRLTMGLGQATGAILAWLNSDDVYHRQTLARVARFFAAHPKIVLASGDVNYTDVESRYISRIFALPPNRFLTANLGLHCWPQPGCFWPRWAYEQVGGIDTSLRFAMDRDLFLRLVSVGPGKRIPGGPLADFRTHPQAKSSTMFQVAAQEDRALINRYGHPQMIKRYGLLRLMWWLWSTPKSVRTRLYRAYGWEF